MKYIMNGGISTTNIPSYTSDALLLAIHEDSLSGVELNLYPTKDHAIVAYNTPTVDHGKEKIEDLTLHNLQRRNFGSRVRRHPILKLSEALNIFEATSKMLVLNIDEETATIEFLDQLLEMTGQYPNIDIYIKTPTESSLHHLQEYAQKQRIGASINLNNQNLWQENLDFFCVDEAICDIPEMDKKIKENKRIMIESVDTIEQYLEICKKTKNMEKGVYIITDTISNLDNILIENYNKNK